MGLLWKQPEKTANISRSTTGFPKNDRRPKRERRISYWWRIHYPDLGSASDLAWVSGVSGEKRKDGSEKGRELFSPLPALSHLKSPLP